MPPHYHQLQDQIQTKKEWKFIRTLFYIVGLFTAIGVYMSGGHGNLNHALLAGGGTVDSGIWDQTLCHGNNCTDLNWTKPFCQVNTYFYPLSTGVIVVCYCIILLLTPRSNVINFILCGTHVLLVLLMFGYKIACVPLYDDRIKGEVVISSDMTNLFYLMTGYSGGMIVGLCMC